MANQIFKSPLSLSKAFASDEKGYPSTRTKWNRYFKHIGDGNPRTVDKYNNLLVEIESELPFKDQAEHDKWLDLSSRWMGEEEWPSMTEDLISRSEASPIDFDENQINEVLKKAKADFPNDWGDEVDYIKQQLKGNWDEDITQVYPKNGYLYGVQSFPEAEPKEVVLYKLRGGK